MQQDGRRFQSAHDGASARAASEAAPPTACRAERDSAARRGAPAIGNVILDVRDLRTYFFTYDGVVKALDGVSFNVRRGETVGLVGETGCGKSVTAFSITKLIADPPGRIMDGIDPVQGGQPALRGRPGSPVQAHQEHEPGEGHPAVYRRIRQGLRTG